jgi:uncharacterized membrane protein
MYETHARSIAKSVVWRFIATTVSFIVTYYFTGSLANATEISLVSAIVSTVVYYLHERAWDKIVWGRAKRHSK